MTAIIEWFKALQGIDWVLVVTILLILGVYIYLLVKIPRLPYVGGFFGKKRIRIVGIPFGFLIAFYVFYNLHELQPNEWVEISLLAGLVAATGGLAVYAAAQAYASVKMADGMARPVIDFKRDTAKADIDRRTLEAYAASSEDVSHGLSCILCNVGVGSAIDVRSFIQHPERGRLPWEFGTIESRGKTKRRILSISHESNRIALVACYEDIYGRTLKSSREVSIDKENHDWKLGRLKVVPVKKDENND